MTVCEGQYLMFRCIEVRIILNRENIVCVVLLCVIIIWYYSVCVYVSMMLDVEERPTIIVTILEEDF